MATFRNTAKGIRGVLLKGGQYAFINPGETKTVKDSRIAGVPEGLEKVDPIEAAADQPPLDPPPADLVDDDSGDDSSGDKPLSDLKRDELEALAKKEGIDVSLIDGSGKGGNVLVGDIVDAIEAKRNAANG